MRICLSGSTVAGRAQGPARRNRPGSGNREAGLDHHEGRIEVQNSSDGHGTKFTVGFPVKKNSRPKILELILN